MDIANIESWLPNEKDTPEVGMRTAFPSCLRRPRPAIPASSLGYPDRDWTNPNRFSDPLNRSSRLSNTMGLTLPSRPNKAYTWYLENELPWRLTAARAKAAKDDPSAYSLFGKNWKPANAAGDVDAESRKKRRNGASFTWERVRQDRARTVIQHYNTLEPRPTTRASDRLSPHTLTKPCVSPNGTWNRRRSPVNNAYSVHLKSPHGSPSESKRSSPSPSRHSLGTHLMNRHCDTSPCSSQRSSPNRSPQGTLSHLSPGLVRRYSPNLHLSPTQHSVLGASFGGSPQYGPSQTLSRSAFVSQWVNNSSPSSYQLSPYSARSSQTSSSREDVSYGSETDDDFFYISCKQLSQGLADLSVTSTERFNPPHGGHIVENPTFVLPDDDDNVDDDDDFIGCSDDALSDDVFLDSPQPSVGGSKRTPQSRNASWEHAQNDPTTLTEQAAGDGDSETGTDTVDHPAVESLRRNSLQSRLRQTWQHRRHKAAASRAVKLKRATVDTPLQTPSDTSLSLSPSDDVIHNTSPASSAAEDGSTARPPEAKPRFYYVISPTDDVNMPDVIAVRRSSVELIRWQNSLRRRRRRQAKRHDLGRNKKKEPKQSGTV